MLWRRTGPCGCYGSVCTGQRSFLAMWPHHVQGAGSHSAGTHWSQPLVASVPLSLCQGPGEDPAWAWSAARNTGLRLEGFQRNLYFRSRSGPRSQGCLWPRLLAGGGEAVPGIHGHRRGACKRPHFRQSTGPRAARPDALSTRQDSTPEASGPNGLPAQPVPQGTNHIQTRAGPRAWAIPSPQLALGHAGIRS